jgi:hypothetical protein
MHRGGRFTRSALFIAQNDKMSHATAPDGFLPEGHEV